MMISRRRLLSGGTSCAFLPLAACGELEAIFSPSPQGAVDIHCHIFNGRDLPVTGFLRQVVIREPDEPVRRDLLTESFLKLIALILLSGTPSPQAELRQLSHRSLTASTGGDVLREDERNVAGGIAEFRRQSGDLTAGFTTRKSADDEVLLQIERELGFGRTLTASRSKVDYPATLAREIYREGTGARDRSGRFRTSGSAILQTIRWAGLLTRPRQKIFEELKRLYGGEGQIRILSPSLVDLGAWLLPRDRVSGRKAQIDVFSKIAEVNKDDLILSFAPFCPLRAALEAEDNPGIDTLRFVKYALRKGFAGVKLYPPMGFLPLGNVRLRRPRVRRWPRAGGRALDDQLRALYDWCAAEDVPIKAHANNSIAAQHCSGRFASPRNWEPVLSQPRYQNLRLNLAHFGGFDETRAPGVPCADQTGGDWEDVMAGMIARYPNLYFDLGYWSEVIDGESAAAADVIARMRALVARVPGVAQRMMYGSDWSMIARLPGHNRYKRAVEEAVARIVSGAAAREAVLGGNALAYLGLQQGTKQHARLAPFFADNTVFRETF